MIKMFIFLLIDGQCHYFCCRSYFNNDTCIRTNFVSVTLFSFAVIFVLSLFRTSFMICSTIQLLMVVTYKRCSFYSVLILKTKYSQRITDRTKCWSIYVIYICTCTCIMLAQWILLYTSTYMVCPKIFMQYIRSNVKSTKNICNFLRDVFHIRKIFVTVCTYDLRHKWFQSMK